MWWHWRADPSTPLLALNSSLATAELCSQSIFFHFQGNLQGTYIWNVCNWRQSFEYVKKSVNKKINQTIENCHLLNCSWFHCGTGGIFMASVWFAHIFYTAALPFHKLLKPLQTLTMSLWKTAELCRWQTIINVIVAQISVLQCLNTHKHTFPGLSYTQRVEPDVQLPRLVWQGSMGMQTRPSPL